MQTRLDPSTRQFLDRLAETTRRMEGAQREISSGKRFTNVSDDPDQVSTLLQTRLELETTEQIKQDLARFKTEVDTAEKALDSASSIMERARVLGVQAQPEFVTPEARTAIAEQVKGLIERMTAIANTIVEGRYIFSGDGDGQPAYTLDFANAPPYGSYQGQASTRQAATADGSRLDVSRTAQQVFEVPLAALEQLRNAITAGAWAGIEAAIGSVTDADDHLRAQHAWYGSVQTRVNDGMDSASQRALRYKTQIGALEDADVATAVLEFQQAKFQREAALQAHAQIPRKSLFDYLG